VHNGGLIMNKKTKVLVLSDHPFSPSGVGTQTKYMLDACLKTGRYSFICLGGAMSHTNYDPVKTAEWGDDLIVFPVDGYGNHDIVRSMMINHKPDIVWFMTDPRFWHWLWEIENEIRAQAPMVYYHVWDNYPYPKYNEVFYSSCDKIVTISKVTDDLVRNVAPDVDVEYLPHAVDQNIFKPLEEEQYQELYDVLPTMKGRTVFFWNNRNARRKQSGALIWWFKEFADKVGRENVGLVMHTNPKDEHGQDLEAIINELGINDGTVVFSTTPVPSHILAQLYNMSACVINISDAEGFGLATLESLACGTPIIVNMTGGLQEQVTDGENWFGIGIEPSSKSVIGSQQVPYIYEDRISKEDFIDALVKIYEMSPEERQKLGHDGLEHVTKNYNFKQFEERWINLLDDLHESHGSWEERKKYVPWTLEEITP